MPEIRVKINDFKRAFNKMLKADERIVQEAAVGTLNDAGYFARKTLIDEFRKDFTVRNKTFPLAVRYEKATPNKMDIAISFPEDWMYLHTVGGKKKPEDHLYLSIPIGGQDRDSRGRMRQRDKPTALLKYADSHPIKSKGHAAVKRPFILDTKDGRAFIVKRDKSTTTQASRTKGSPDKFLYVLKKSANIEKRWDFKQIVHDVITPSYMAKKFDKWCKFLLKKKGL